MRVPKDAINLRCYHTWMGDDGIARTKVKANVEVVLEDAIENSAAVNSFDKINYTLIVDSRQVKTISKGARDYFSMNGRNSKVVAFAIIIGSPLSKMVANFFMGLNKPRVPMKIFNNESKAIEWCLNKMD